MVAYSSRTRILCEVRSFSGNLSLGQRTGDGEVLMGGVLGRLWMVFLGGGGEEETPSPNSPFLILYIIY